MTKSVKSKISKNAKKAFLFLNYNFPFFEIFDFQDLDVFLNNAPFILFIYFFKKST